MLGLPGATHVRTAGEAVEEQGTEDEEPEPVPPLVLPRYLLDSRPAGGPGADDLYAMQDLDEEGRAQIGRRSLTLALACELEEGNALPHLKVLPDLQHVHVFVRYWALELRKSRPEAQQQQAQPPLRR
jgi:hypothetical protein